MPGVSTAEGVVVPAAGDTFDYLGEMRRKANSQRTVVPVADRAAAEVVAAAMATDNRPVSDTNPLVVFRLDTQRVEIKNSAGWGGPPQGIQTLVEYKQLSGAIGPKAVVMNVPSFTFIGGRSYRLEVEGNWYVTQTASTFVGVIGTCAVSDAASSVNNIATLVSFADNPNAAMEGRRLNGSIVYRPTTTVTQQVKFTFERATGGAGGYIQGSANEPFQMRIYDEGILPTYIQS